MFFHGPSDHTIHIQLNDVDPPIWRRLRVPSDLPLPTFARAIETAMGWQSYHLYQFDIGGVIFGMVGDEFTDHVIDETAILVRHILPREGSEVQFDYDFGDDWHHSIRVESLTERITGSPPIEVLDGSRSCPPEDVGGIWGYANLLEALADPTHEEHQSMRTWAGKAFDAEQFDLVKTQRAVAKLSPKRPSRRKPHPTST